MPPEPTRSGVMSVRAPAESKVLVAVPPKYAVPVLEKRVEEALRNDWRAVQLLALPMLRESEEAVPPICEPSVPELERDAPMASEEVAVEYTTPELPARRPEREVASVVAPVTFRVPPTTVLPEESIVVDAVCPAENVLAVRRPAKKLVEVASVNERVEGSENVGFPPVPSPFVTVIWLVVPVSVRTETPEVPFDESIPTRFWKVTAPEAMRFVVEAVTAVTIVVEA